ncbi:MAG: disulfide bond formation protein B [Candidatus Gracilibacteria bacterium]|nr:disulfide bond formation protein B [Candidatus Gracilibacteria bacterium]
MSLEQFSLIVGICLVIGQAIFILGWFLFAVSSKFRTWISGLFSRQVWTFLTLLLIVGSIGGSLIYSNIYELAVCEFCWYQRMAIYPQAIILVVALWKKEYISGIVSSLVLSSIGIVLAAYQYSLNVRKMLHPDTFFAPCDASGISCADVPIVIFGYITIPFMTIAILLLSMTTLYFALKTKKI